LFVNERVSAVVVAFEIVRRRLAAQVAVNALVVHVVFARDVFGIAICSVSHKISLEFAVQYGGHPGQWQVHFSFFIQPGSLPE
jgi:hypothetical protein